MIIDVIDLKIDSLNFLRSYDYERKRRGEQLYRRGCVQIKEVDKKENNEYKVTAYVEGNYDYYAVVLNIVGNVVKKYSCECKDYQGGNICKHILATCSETIEPHYASTSEGRKRKEKEEEEERQEAMRQWKLRLEEEAKKREYESKYYKALKALKEYKNDDINVFWGEETSDNFDVKDIYEETMQNLIMQNKYSPDLATDIRIEPQIQLENNNYFNVTFKMGQKTKYVLKDIGELYNAFQKGEILQFGKNLKFEAKRESFNKEDLKILDLILQYGEILRYSGNLFSHSYYNSPRISTKYLTVFENKMEEFFEAIKNRPIEVSIYNQKEMYQFTDEKLDINVEISKPKKSNDYILKININDYRYIVSDKNIYIFMNYKIYKLDKAENEKIIGILKLFNFDEEILIPEDKISDFSTYIFPKMDNYLVTQNLPEEQNNKALLVNKLASKMFLDLDDENNITMELKFCYEDCEFNILDNNYKQIVEEKNIVRNKLEEKDVLTKIFTDGFELEKNKKYFVLKDTDATYEFLVNKIEEYMNNYEILVTDRFKKLEIKKPRLSSVSVKLNNGLLELDISKLDFDIDELKNVLKNYNVKKKYYKLKNGNFLSIEQNEDMEFLNEMSNSFDVDFNKMQAGVIKLPVNRSIYLENLLNKNKSISSNKNDDFSKLINNIEDKNFSDNIKVEKDFENILRDYQKTGYKWLKVLEEYHMGGVLADDMGLGKTLQVIALLASDIKTNKTSIVVCPSSLVLNWKAEIEKWCKKIKVCTIKGDAETRKQLINSYNEYDLLVTSYDLLKRDVLEYEGKTFKYVIADEAQYIKNFTTQNATALKSLEGENKFALTGTPIENSVSELWSIFDFIMPGYLYSYSKFKKKIEEPIIKEEDKAALERLKALISPFVLRRTKKEVLTELPEKNITIMNNEMLDEQQKIYMSYFMQTKKEVAKELSENAFEKSKFKILMLLTRLRQICCHPGLFIENYKGDSGKLNQCMDIITDAIESGHRILLFSSYTSMFEILEEKLNNKKIKYYKLTGSTSVGKRVEMCEHFNKDDSIKVFLISLKAGGTGLNLTGADVVIHYDPWWNLSAENQATDRAYRIGQKNSVQVYKLITANSIEEKINKLQEKKAELSEQLLSTEETFINKLSKEEIMSLFE